MIARTCLVYIALSSRRNAAAEDLILMIHGAPAVHWEDDSSSPAPEPLQLCVHMKVLK